ncbi:MAG: cyclic nucleotide-binding protein [Arcobacter sp.]|nr:MAG: cyclic nucleotide-binding protein [Arcobacter sp.]
MSLLEIKSFVSSIKPFDYLESKELEEVCSHLDIVYFKNDTEILTPHKQAEFLYFIIKGVVQEKNEDEVISVYAQNEFFDPFTLIRNDIKHTYVTVQESICYMLPKDIFLKYMYQNDEIESYFFSTISEKLNNSVNNEKSKEFLSFAIAKVEDAYIQKPIYVNEDETIHNTVKKLIDNKIQSMLVKRADGELGIVTDSDFVKKAIYNRIDLDTEVAKITTYGLEAVSATDFLFNAQLIMSKKKLKRLLVKKDEEIIGTLDIVSLNSYFASHTHSTSSLLDNAVSLEELKDASSRFIKTIRTLYEKGVKVRYISKLISQLNEKLFEKLFDLTAPEELKENACLVIMGSEGRSEQILRTDQDNALILSDDCKMDKNAIMEYTQTFTNNLVDFGYPLCDGNIMVSNPYWVKTYTEFKDEIFQWITKPSEEGFMNLAIFYDAISVTGDSKLLHEVKEYVFHVCNNATTFYPYFARPILSFETPLSMFSDFVVDKDKHKDELDLKKGGIFPIVHGVRSLSIEKQIEETSTFERLKELHNLGVIEEEFKNELIETFNYLLSLRLKFRLEKTDAHEKLDNYINPSKLSILEKDLLKDSLKIVNKFKKFVSYHFKLSMIS